MRFPPAPQPDILRAHQKDVLFLQQYTKSVQDIAGSFLGSRFQLHYNSEIALFTKLCYFILTTGLGSQTLGEEYCDIIQTNKLDGGSVPSISRRFILLSFQLILPYLYDRHILSTSTFIPTASIAEQRYTFQQKFKDIMERVKPKLRNFDPLLKKYLLPLHLALFYFKGEYYQLEKRILGIKYTVIRSLSSSETRISYEILGILIIIQLLISSLQSTSKLHSKLTQSSNGDTSVADDGTAAAPEQNVKFAVVSSKTCTLCLEQQSYPTVTQCGHVFCWDCICEWCREKPECPLCRQHLTPQKFLRIRYC